MKKTGFTPLTREQEDTIRTRIDEGMVTGDNKIRAWSDSGFHPETLEVSEYKFYLAFENVVFNLEDYEGQSEKTMYGDIMKFLDELGY